MTVFGSSEGPVAEEQLRDWSEEANETLALLLAESWYVEVFDPVWGRNGALLSAALEAMAAAESSGSGNIHPDRTGPVPD